MTARDLIDRCKAFDEIIRQTIISEKEETFSIRDGIVDPERFISAKYKILWILKEPYDEFDAEGLPFGGDWDLKEVIRSKNSISDFASGKPTFKPMIYTSWGILNGFTKWNDMDSVEDDPSMLDALKSVAYINISKLPGFKSTHHSVCTEAYATYKDLLLNQVRLIDADVIIGGGTLHHFLYDLDLINSDRYENGSIVYYQKDGKLYIQAYHPAQRSSSTGVSQQQYCDDIISAVKNWALK